MKLDEHVRGIPLWEKLAHVTQNTFTEGMCENGLSCEMIWVGYATDAITRARFRAAKVAAREQQCGISFTPPSSYLAIAHIHQYVAHPRAQRGDRSFYLVDGSV